MARPPEVDDPSGADGPDPWQLAGLPGGLALASYLTAGHGTGAQYRLIVDVLLDQQQHSLTGVPHDELDTLLRDRVTAQVGREHAERLLTGFSLKNRMDQLEAWQVVHVWDERPTRDEDFLRNSNRYQLTPLAAQFHRAVRRLGDDVAGSVAATFAPMVLHAQLDLMVTALGNDPAAVAAAWAVVRPTLDSMAEAAAGWQARLAGALAGAPDATKVAALQETLRRYVDMWGAGVDVHSGALGQAATQLREAGPAVWRAVALHTLGAQASDAEVAELVGQYDETLRTVLAWFAGSGAQARQLRRQMRDAIAPMVRGQRTLAAVGGHVSRRAELLALAGALEAAPDDNAGWNLWCAATGLFSARHLAMRSPQPEGAAGATSFWEALPAPVEARLRRQGPRALAGRPARIADRSAGRAQAQAAAAAAREQAARTRAGVLARSGQRLSEWTNLDPTQLDAMLALLAAVATAPGHSGEVRTARTGDGLWQLRAEPAPAGAPAAVVHTAQGRFAHPNIRLFISATGMATDGLGPAGPADGTAQ